MLVVAQLSTVNALFHRFCFPCWLLCYSTSRVHFLSDWIIILLTILLLLCPRCYQTLLFVCFVFFFFSGSGKVNLLILHCGYSRSVLEGAWTGLPLLSYPRTTRRRRTINIIISNSSSTIHHLVPLSRKKLNST